MNRMHLEICASDEWAELVQNEIIPFAIGGVSLGEDVIEVGPGPGRTTDVLRTMVGRLTSVEIDPMLAAALAQRMAGTNVEVVEADATRLPFGADRFTAATSFTMLHHVPSPELQDQLFRELARVLRPGGVLVGVDSIDSPDLRGLHVDDVCVVVDPQTLPDRLARAGFVDVDVTTNEFAFRFHARVPAG